MNQGRYCLALLCARRIDSQRVIEVLEQTSQEHGRPEHVRCDNGPEFVAGALREWSDHQDYTTRTIYIEPGSPWQNPWAESFHSRLRNDCLNRELFISEIDTQAILDDWRDEYNCQRPHSGIGYKSPIEIFSPEGPGSSRDLLSQQLQTIPALT